MKISVVAQWAIEINYARLKMIGLNFPNPRVFLI